MSAHSCIADTNALMADRNLQIEPIFSLYGGDQEYIAIATAKIDSKKRGTTQRLFASFCPFCGVRLNVGSKS